MMSLIFIFQKKLIHRLPITNNIFYLSLMINGFIFGSMIFEVQGRYHVILYLPLVLLISACTIAFNKKSKHLAE